MLKEVYQFISLLESKIDYDCKVILTKERSLLCIRADVWVKADKYSCAKIFPLESLDITDVDDIVKVFNKELKGSIKL